MGLVCVILSGNGGTGKTTLTAALAQAVIQSGKSCCCVELCALAPCLELLLQASPMEKRENLQYYSVPKLPKEEAAGQLREWKKRYDFILVDAPSGLPKGLSPYLEAADRLLLVIRPDRFSIRCAEALLLHQKEKNGLAPAIVISRMHPLWIRRGQEPSPQQIAGYLGCSLLGYIPEDGDTSRTWLEGVPLFQGKREVTKALKRVSRRFLGEYVPMPSILPQASAHAIFGKEADGCNIIQDTLKPISI